MYMYIKNECYVDKKMNVYSVIYITLEKVSHVNPTILLPHDLSLSLSLSLFLRLSSLLLLN